MTDRPRPCIGQDAQCGPRDAAIAFNQAQNITYEAWVSLSPGRESHSDTTLYISSLILHTEYTGWCENDFNVYA